MWGSGSRKESSIYSHSGSHASLSLAGAHDTGADAAHLVLYACAAFLAAAVQQRVRRRSRGRGIPATHASVRKQPDSRSPRSPGQASQE